MDHAEKQLLEIFKRRQDYLRLLDHYSAVNQDEDTDRMLHFLEALLREEFEVEEKILKIEIRLTELLDQVEKTDGYIDQMRKPCNDGYQICRMTVDALNGIGEYIGFGSH